MEANSGFDRGDNLGRRLLAIGLISLSGLALEIGLTRLFSVLFFPQTVFAILSLAILGIGLGAAFVTWRTRWCDTDHLSSYVGLASLIVLAIVVVASVPFLQYALFGLVVFPYLFIGMALTTIFSTTPQQSTQLYLADLIGAGLGALLSIPLLNLFGGLTGVLSISLLLALAGAVLLNRQVAQVPLAALVLSFTLFGANLLFDLLTINMDSLPTDKPIAGGLDNSDSEIVDSQWDAFARTDLIDPGGGGPRVLYIDGAAGSVMPSTGNDDYLWDDIGLLPFATEQPSRVFLIGPGGGLDVWFALQGGAEEINGAEVNRASVELVREYADYNGDLYGLPNVTIQIDDGRSVLQRDSTHYDLIFLSQVVTLAAERNGYSLVENSSYTIEAFEEYLKHLTPDGQIGIKLYDEPTLTRALSTALATFRQQGLSDQQGLKHIIALLDANVDPPIPLLLISKKAFSQEDSFSLGSVAQQVGFTPLFLPGALAQPPLDGVAAGTMPFSAVNANSENDLSATTDDQPFFYQFEPGIPQSLRPLLWGVAAMMLIGTGLVVLHQRGAANGRWAVSAPLYFAGLGLGFIMVEIGLIQQTRLFLGHPTTATAVVLATLLVFGGIGSGLASRLFLSKEALAVWPILVVILYLALWRLFWPWLQDQAFGAQPAVRTLLVIASLLPLGLAMGMPFPLGLKAVAELDRRQVALAWTINGVMSVVGSVLAMALAIQFGFTTVLIAGGVAYGLALSAAFLTTYIGASHPRKSLKFRRP